MYHRNVISLLFIIFLTISSSVTDSPKRTISPGNKWPGRIVINYNNLATSGIYVDTTIINQMLDSTVKTLSGKQQTTYAWRAIFPETLHNDAKIAIKTNLINPGLVAPHHSLIQSLVRGLLSIRFDDSTGLDPHNIIIYDANNRHSFDEAEYTDLRFPGIQLVKDTIVQWGDGAIGFGYARSLHECDYLINVFSLSGHNQNYGGFFLGFKNHYGSYDPALASKNQRGLVLMNCTGPVFNKTVLTICCGLFGIDEGKGPFGGVSDFSTYVKSIDPNSKEKNPNTFIISTDPVSCETQAIKILRVNKRRPYIIDSLPEYLKSSAGIKSSLSPVYNIGIIDEKLMDIRKIITVSH
jgi:hypothetical protein